MVYGETLQPQCPLAKLDNDWEWRLESSLKGQEFVTVKWGHFKPEKAINNIVSLLRGDFDFSRRTHNASRTR